MNSLLYTSDDSIRGICVTQLLFKGINVFSSNKIEQLITILIEKDINCIFLDVDELFVDWIKLIRNIKEIKKNSTIYTVILTSFDDQILLNKFIIEGINAIFYKGEYLVDSINKITFELINLIKNEKREFIRIYPNMNENVSVKIHVDGNGSFDAKLLDISLAGASIYLEDENAIDYINKFSSHINTFQIIINQQPFHCCGEIKHRFNNKFIIKYSQTNNIFDSGIAGYIFNKINY